MSGNAPVLNGLLETFTLIRIILHLKGCYVFMLMQPIRSFITTKKELSQVLVVRENG